MAYPTDKPNFTNPTATDNLDTAGVLHDVQHSDLNDTVEALMDKLGTGTSTPTTVDHVLKVTGVGATAYGPSPTGTSKRGATRIVAASNAHSGWTSAADYVCDGTNDQDEINTAIGALTSNIGGQIILSDGTFNIGSTGIICEKPGVHIRGQGWAPPDNFAKRGGTRLKAVTGISGSVMRFSFNSNAENNSFCKVSDLGIDGDNVGSGIKGLYWRTQWSIIFNIAIYDMSGDGLYTIGSGSGAQTFDNQYIGMMIKGCGGWGMNMDSFSGDGQMIANVVSSCTGGGARNFGSSNQWILNHFYSNDNYGFEVGSGAARVKMLGTKMEHNNGGILWAGSQGMIQNCSFANDGESPRWSIEIDGSSNIISNNQIRKDTGDGTGDDLGLKLDGSSNLVVGNIFNGFTGGNIIQNNGSSNKAAANLGASDFG